MNDEQYLAHCTELLAEFAKTLSQRTEALEQDDGLRALAVEFQRLANDPAADVYNEVGSLVGRLFTTYPDFAPTFPGNCCGFLAGTVCTSCPMMKSLSTSNWMTSAARLRDTGEIFDLQAARAKLLKLQ